ncbi:hypothetical protein GJAV_G00254140 [Gymnothorax javanicus]|nr:hypothetical protein GJAV_G00254140 [Gymnothorax javanicus]
MGLGRREYGAPPAGLLRKRKCVKSSFALKDEPFGNAQKRVSSRQRVPATNNHLSDCLRSSRSRLGAKGTSSGRRLMLLDFKSPSGKSESPTSLSGSSPPAEGTLRRPARFLRSNTSPQEPQSRTADSEVSPASSCGTQRPQLGPALGSGVSLGLEETVEDEAESSRSLEKYRLLSVLGLQRKSQFPDPVQPAGWQQKQRLRKLKVLSYALTAPRGLRPASPGTSSLPVKDEPPEPIAVEEAGSGRGCLTNRARPLRHREVLRRSVRIRDAPLQNLPRLRARKAEPRARAPRKRPVRVKREPAHPAVSPFALPDCSTPGHQQGEPSFNRRGRGPPDPSLVRGGSHARLVGSTVRECTRKARVNDGAPWWSKSIKDEPADLFPVSVAPELGKRQSKPPVKLLDPGFLFEFCRPVGIKREPEGGDKRVSQSVERLKQRGRASRLRCEGRGVASQGLHRARSGTAKVDRCLPKKHKQRPLLENTRAVRKKGPAPMTSHTCVLCRAKCRNCDAVIMHQIRHTEGKHWPCPLCSKTFFRQRNVQSHIRTHDPNLYKCRSCISAT